MRSLKTQSEELFESFLCDHGIPFERIPETEDQRPDYAVGSGMPWGPIIFEVKELTKDNDFKRGQFQASTRTVGDHIRSKINKSKKQVKYGANQGIPSILLIYNALDPVFHSFGTDDHDFAAAMHGDLTLVLSTQTGKFIGAGRGGNRSLRENQNTSFTALGHLAPNRRSGIMSVRLFLNEYAKAPLPVGLPTCFEIVD